MMCVHLLSLIMLCMFNMSLHTFSFYEICSMAFEVKFNTKHNVQFPCMDQINGRRHDKVVLEPMVASLGMNGMESTLTGRKLEMNRTC